MTDCQEESTNGERDSPLDESVVRRIYHAVNDAIFVHDADSGEILDVNQPACELYGYSRDEARTLTIEDLSSGEPPYTQEAAIEYVQKAADGEPQVFDWQAEDSDGNTFWVEVSMRHAVFDDAELVIVIVRDISERKAHEGALQRLHTTTRALMGATSPDAVARIASETTTDVLDLPLNGVHLFDQDADALVPVAWSNRLEAVFDGPPPPIPAGKGLAWQAYTNATPEVYEDVRTSAEVLNPETPFRSELYLPLGDHGVLIVGSTVPDDFDAAEEALARVFAANVEAALDNVEREREVARSKDRLEAFFEHSPDAIVLHDAAGEIYRTNGRTSRTWGTLGTNSGR